MDARTWTARPPKDMKTFTLIIVGVLAGAAGALVWIETRGAPQAPVSEPPTSTGQPGPAGLHTARQLGHHADVDRPSVLERLASLERKVDVLLERHSGAQDSEHADRPGAGSSGQALPKDPVEAARTLRERWHSRLADAERELDAMRTLNSGEPDPVLDDRMADVRKAREALEGATTLEQLRVLAANKRFSGVFTLP